MSLRSLLKKELRWSRRNLLTLVFIFLLLPAVFVSTTIAFQNVIPRDAPVAVTPQDETVTQDDLTVVKGGITLFSDPEIVDSTDRARDKLTREEVYAIIQVPPRITHEDEDNATFVLFVHGSIVPFTPASNAIRNLMAFYLDRTLPADVTVERVVFGTENTLSEYLVPLFLMWLLMIFAFTYVPYNLATEANVLDRLRVESSMEALVGAKLLFFTVIAIVPIMVFQLMAEELGYVVGGIAPMTVGILLLTFFYLIAFSTAIMVLTKFSPLGRFLNVLMLVGLLSFSGLAYPVGYFSPLRKLIVRLIPLHYSGIITRSSMLKDVEPGLFTDWILLLVGFTVGSVLVLKLSIVHYRRTI